MSGKRILRFFPLAAVAAVLLLTPLTGCMLFHGGGHGGHGVKRGGHGH